MTLARSHWMRAATLLAVTLVATAAVADQNAPSFVRAISSSGFLPGFVNSPEGICNDPAGNIYVADRSNNRIQKFDQDGNLLLNFGSLGTEPGQFADPDDVAVPQLHGGGQSGGVDQRPVGAAEICDPEDVAALAHLGVQPRSERIFDAKVIARGAAYRYSWPVQIYYGIAVRRCGSDNQTWHRVKGAGSG